LKKKKKYNQLSNKESPVSNQRGGKLATKEKKRNNRPAGKAWEEEVPVNLDWGNRPKPRTQNGTLN